VVLDWQLLGFRFKLLAAYDGEGFDWRLVPPAILPVFAILLPVLSGRSSYTTRTLLLFPQVR
jgi:hypothetical protein